MKRGLLLVLTLLLCVGVTGCKIKVNGSIHIDDGEKTSGIQTTINGSVYIGSDAYVGGSCRSVNGQIEVGNHSRVKDLQTVNGNIELDREVMVNGNVESVNGDVTAEAGTEINGRISTINGSIDLRRVIVERDLQTYNGNIDLSDQSCVRGDIIIKRNKGNSSRRRRINIDIQEGSVVEGGILVRDDDIDVRVYLSTGGRVLGRIAGAEVIEE